MQPHGSEVVLCVTGSITLHQQSADGSTASTVLEAGQYAIDEPGTWHKADVAAEATALFITAVSARNTARVDRIQAQANCPRR